MATLEPPIIATAVRTGLLERVPLPDWESRLPIRNLYGTPDFLDDIEQNATLVDLNLSIANRTLYDHLWQMFADFRCAARPGAGNLRRMMPVDRGIWSMRPPKLRVYGWCPFTHAFVAVTWALEEDTKADKKLNNKMRDEVLAFIKKNKLEGGILKGEYLETFPNQ